MNTLLQDLRFAPRQMRRSPGFAITAVLILALGISANVIVFGVLQALILRPLEVPHPERVMTLARTSQTNPFSAIRKCAMCAMAIRVFSAVAALAISGFGLEANGHDCGVRRYLFTRTWTRVPSGSLPLVNSTTPLWMIPSSSCDKE